MKNKKQKYNLNTGTIPTWCPGCFNFQILAGFKSYLSEKIKTKKDAEKYAIVTGIGCHAKMFDYVNLNGLNSLHGRVLPTCLGIKTAEPEINVFGFAGDGDAYSEGVSHLLHASRYNSNFTFIVHNNQVFALTVGQPTATSEKGFTDKTTPKGVKNPAINPIKLMLSSGCGFIARVSADVNQIKKVLKEAEKYTGFKFIEVLQPCIIFHPDQKYGKRFYNLQEKGHDKSDWDKAMKKAQDFDYEKIDEKTKIPLEIFYQDNNKRKREGIFEERV